jgi:hypothetical protein
MDTMISFTDNNLSNKFLSEEELRKICPMAFKEAPTNPKVSDRYVQANTMTVVRDLAKMGWYPVQAKQCRTRKNSSGIHSFHMIAFQNPEVRIEKNTDDGTVIDTWPRIILTNSHDGFNSFKFMVGLFRMICSNGLVVGSDEMVNMSIRHINYTFEALRVVVRDAIAKVPQIVSKMNTMRQITLSEEDQVAIATEVERIRRDIDAKAEFAPEEEVINDILAPVREEDKGSDLWSVFNRCQEKMIKGGYYTRNPNNKYRKQRRITSIKKDIDYNQRLWDFVSRLVPAEVAS